MTRLAPLALPTLFAACSSAAGPLPIEGATGARSCPPVEAIRIAVWSGIGGERGVPEAPHWQVHLRDDLEQYSEDGSHAPVWDEPLGARTEVQVRDRQPGPLGGEAWLYRDGATAPCAAKVTGYYLAETSPGDGGTSRTLAAQVEGCAPAEESSYELAWAVIGTGAPDGCAQAEPARIGARMLDYEERSGEATGDAALPAPVASFLPDGPCAEPDCLKLWDVSRARAGDIDVYQATVTWLDRTPGEPDMCSWPGRDRHGLLVGRGDAAATPLELRGQVFDYEEGRMIEGPRALSLDAVLHDPGGTRILLTEASGVYGVHELAGDRIGPGRMVDWYLPHDEDSDWFTMAPYCGP